MVSCVQCVQWVPECIFNLCEIFLSVCCIRVLIYVGFSTVGRSGLHLSAGVVDSLSVSGLWQSWEMYIWSGEWLGW